MKTFGLAKLISHMHTKGTFLEFQTKMMSQYTELHDLELVKVIQDAMIGALENRDGIEVIKSEVRNGKVEVLFIYNTSRCLFSMFHFTKLYEYLNQHNVALISVSRGISFQTKKG